MATASASPAVAHAHRSHAPKQERSGTYIDPRYLTAVPFGAHSHWLQPWRAYQETLPAQTFLKAQGVVVNLPDKENPDLLMHMLAKYGMRNVRIEISWGFVNYFDEGQLNFSDRLKALLLAGKKYHIRPLILLNANEGVPVPTNVAERVLARKAGRADREIELTDVSDLKVGYSGLANVTQSRASEILIIGIRGHTVQLSKPLPRDLGEAGTGVTLTTLKYRPFSAPDTPDYRATMEGWQRYVGTVARFAADTLGTRGQADVGFDLEIWNELTFGSAFLSINNYYEPKPAAYDENSIWHNLVRETADYVTAHPADFRGATLVDGFRNTIPWPAASQEPERVGALSFHPYPGRKNYPADEQGGPAINALFAADQKPFTPRYSVLFPEYYGSALQTETVIRDMAPITTPIAAVPHGRNARVRNGKAIRCPLWFTETGFVPKEQGITDPNAALAIKAKTTLRSTCFHVGKGLERIYFYSALSGDTDLGIVQDNFAAYIRSHNVYPGNDVPYVSPTLRMLGRLTAKMGVGLDPKLVKTRPLTVLSLTDAHNHIQFQGDGSPEHPALFNREVFVFVPFQANARRFVIPYYVMTRDVTKELAPEEYTVRLQGVRGRLATVGAYDPLTDAPVPVRVRMRAPDELILTLRATDSPCLLTIDEKDTGRVARPVAAQHAPRTPVEADWRRNMQEVHRRFTGRKGAFAQFGDSITATAAFWTPLPYERRNASPEMERAFEVVKAYQRAECWRDWKGPEYGSESGQTTRWALQNIDGWLKRLNPDVALILFGTNDLKTIEADEYARNLREIVRKCLANGTVVILNTIPPRHDFETKAAAFADAARQVARETGVPLLDFQREILQRRPHDWDGALERFSAYTEYDVPTLLARDGVHPSYPQKYQNDYSDEALRCCGYGLRNFLTLQKYAEVIRTVQAPPVPEKPGQARGEVRARSDLHPPEQGWFPTAPLLPAPTGEILRVTTEDEMYAAAKRVRPGGTILVAEGFYSLPRPLEIKTDRVTLRGASGRRERVILDAGNRGELLRITACSGVTIADLTVQNVQWNGIKLNSETNVQKVTVYHCLLHNIWQRAIKGVTVPRQDRERICPSGCRVQYCLFYNDHAKQFSDDTADTEANFGGNYIGGIDVMYARDWIISDNVFVGIQGRTREARGAVFLWQDIRNCVVERNIVIDCDAGICLGNAFRPDEITVHCTGCIVRNNFITRATENGILADYTRNCKILNNTVYDPQSRLGRLIRLVHDNEGLVVANNLVCGSPIRVESPSPITLRNNLERDLSPALSDPARGDLRLTARATDAIGKGIPLSEVTDDFERIPRSRRPAIGAHEYRAEKPPARRSQ